MEANPNNRRGPVIAIDGPSGTGKSTLARRLAERLGFRYVDTGAMYRAVAVFAEREGVQPDDPEALVSLLTRFRIDFLETAEGLKVLLLQDDISQEIRRPGVGEAASRLSRFPGVRRMLVEAQRALAACGAVVMEGRDIGTVVLPQADLKIFLDAEPEERARRRFREWQGQGVDVPLETVKDEMSARDRRDQTREVAPLAMAEDAVRIDTTGLSPAEVLDLILGLAGEKGIRAESCHFIDQTL